MAVWYFTTNTEVENWSPDTGHATGDPGGRFAWRWVNYFCRFAYGVSVLQEPDDTWVEGRFFGWDETNAAQWYYPGGHQSVVSDANKAAMIAALPDITEDNFTAAPADTPVTPPPTGDDNHPVPPPYTAEF